MKAPLYKIIVSGLIATSLFLNLAAMIHNEGSRIAVDISPSTPKAFDPGCLQRMSQARIFLAHMSVGNNILDGVKAIGLNSPEGLSIVETEDPSQMNLPGLYHARLGNNGDPAAKIRSFESQVAKISIANPDVAMMKLCYVDIVSGRNVPELFSFYRQTLDRLEKQYPRIRFMHCTVPLTSEPPTIQRKFKSAIRSLLGKTTWVHDNSARMEFNSLLRKSYPPERILDIALVESLTPDQRLCYAAAGGLRFPSLCRAYTDDGGHLNEIGARRVAEHFLMSLADLLSSSGKP